MNRVIPSFLILTTFLVLLGGVGCEMERTVTYRNPWNDMFRQSDWYDGSSGSGSGSARSGNKGYAVELGRFSGPSALQQSARLIQSARTEAGLAELWYSSNAAQTTVYAGRFRDPQSDEAQAVLRAARAAKINGEQPFEKSNLVSLGAARAEVLDPRDLRSLSGRGLFTLQIGYYDRNYGLDYRKAAEDRVDELRASGQDAYYFHGPYRSLILLNRYTRSEAFFSQPGQMDRYSNTVRADQERHPHNVPNGKPFTEKDDPEFVKSQTSFLVPIK